MTKGLPVIIPENAEKLVHPNGLKSLSTVAAKADLMMSCVRERFLKKGLSNESTNIIVASWRKSTLIKNQGLDFCKNNNINSRNASVSNELDFLTSLYQNRKQYPTISCARSILSLFIRSSNGLEFGKQSMVQRFMKGIYQLHPSLPKYSFTWDIGILFEKYRELPSND